MAARHGTSRTASQWNNRSEIHCQLLDSGRRKEYVNDTRSRVEHQEMRRQMVLRLEAKPCM